MSGKSGFRVIEENIQQPPQPAPQQAVDQQTKMGLQMILLGLHALSQRTIVAISNLITIGFVASVWVLWRDILANPSTTQIIAVIGYAAFVLLIDIVRRRTK